MTAQALSADCHPRARYRERVRLDPTRSVDWRWQRAWWHIEEDRRFAPARDDEATGRAVAFLRARLRCRTKRQFSGLRRRDPSLYAAYALQESQSRLRMEVEARLLARQGVAVTADRTSLPLAVIEVYEQVFFDVCDYLSAADWIMAHAVGAKFYGLVDADDFAVVVKGLAYRHGPVLLDTILATVVDDGGKFTTAKAGTFETRDGRLAARTALFLLSHLTRQNGALILEIRRINDLISQIEQAEAAFAAPDIDLSTFADSLTSWVAPHLEPETSDETSSEAVVTEHGEAGQGRHVA